MHKSIKVLAIISVAVPASWAGATLMEDTVASVNGKPIMLSEYMKELDSATENFRRTAPAMLNEKDAMSQLKRKVLDQMIDNSLFQEEAERKKIKIHDRELDNGVNEVKERNFRRDETGKMLTDAEVEAGLEKELKKEGLNRSQFRERIRNQLMIRKVIDDDVRPKVKAPEEADLRAAFDKIKFIVKGDTTVVAGMPEDQASAYLSLGERVRDLTAERVRVSHILTKFPSSPSMVEKAQALKKAQELKKRLDAGEEFAEVARKNSEDVESSGRGGDLGFILRGWMPKEFEKTAFNTDVGQISDPIETQFGYHIIRVQEKKAAESAAFDKLKDDLSQFVFNIRFQGELDKAVKALRSTAHIEVNLPKEPKDSKAGQESEKKNN